MLATTLFLAVILSLLDPNPHFASALLTGKQATHDLRDQLSNQSEVVCTSDAAYDSDFTPRYNIAGAPSYQIAVKPALVDDVQKIVSRLSQHLNAVNQLKMNCRCLMHYKTTYPSSPPAGATGIQLLWVDYKVASM